MLTKDQYQELLFSRNCSLYVIEHLDVYAVHHYSPEIFFGKKNGNVIYYTPTGQDEPVTFIVLIESGTLLSQLDDCDVESDERIVVSYRKAIQDRIGYAYVSLQKKKTPLKLMHSRPNISFMEDDEVIDHGN